MASKQKLSSMSYREKSRFLRSASLLDMANYNMLGPVERVTCIILSLLYDVGLCGVKDAVTFAYCTSLQQKVGAEM